jgi:methylated-DNA-protein-cysteine methyltransferase-like protein
MTTAKLQYSEDPNPFTLKVIKTIQSIPKGKVATYQQVAGLAGKMHASRAVAWILHSTSKKYKLPWQRVISKQGKIAFKPQTYKFMMQRRLLTDEGVEVNNKTGAIDMARFQYKKHARRKPNQPRMFG